MQKRTLPRVSRRKIGSKPEPQNIFNVTERKVCREIREEEDRLWAISARQALGLSVPKSLLKPKPHRTTTAAELFDRKVVPCTHQLLDRTFVNSAPTMDDAKNLARVLGVSPNVLYGSDL